MKRINVFATVDAPLFVELLDLLCGLYEPAGIRVFAPDLLAHEESEVVQGLRNRGLHLIVLRGVANAPRSLRRKPHANFYLLADDERCAPIWSISQENPGVVLLTSEDYGRLLSDAGEEPSLGWRALAESGALLSIPTTPETAWQKEIHELDPRLRDLRLSWSRARLAERSGAAASHVFPSTAADLASEHASAVRSLF